jgi:hypothetical protein
MESHPLLGYFSCKMHSFKGFKHVATSENMTPFEQFLTVSHEVKFEPGVKDRFPTIYILSLAIYL